MGYNPNMVKRNNTFVLMEKSLEKNIHIFTLG